jgi:hypothetical protein
MNPAKIFINSPYAEDLETLTPDPSPSGRGEKSPSGGCAPATLVYKPKYRLKEIRIPRNISYQCKHKVYASWHIS